LAQVVGCGMPCGLGMWQRPVMESDEFAVPVWYYLYYATACSELALPTQTPKVVESRILSRKVGQVAQAVGAQTHVIVHSAVGPIPAPASGTMRCVAISDTHGAHESLTPLPQGDVLIHCGDFTNTGTLEECKDFCRWSTLLSFRHKLLVPGNHDLTCDAAWYREHWQEWHGTWQSPDEVAAMLGAAGWTVLNRELVQVCGISVYGSPVQPRQPKMRPQMAFGRRRGLELREEWACLPPRGVVDLLLTHTPPAGVLDVGGWDDGKDMAYGCEELAKAVARTAPAVHVFGHIHRSYGVRATRRTVSINASSGSGRRGAAGLANPPIVFDVCKGQSHLGP